MKKLVLLIKTALKLGLLNTVYIIWYRFSLKSGIRKYFFQVRTFPLDEIHYLSCQPRTDYSVAWINKTITEADHILAGEFRFYSYHLIKTGFPPNWFQNYFNEKIFINIRLHWTKIPDFSDVGDIKNIWELSRFDWIVTLAKAFSISGRPEYLNSLNFLINDWKTKNPLNMGPNWNCGQEVSVRVFNLINASLVLNQELNPSKALADFVYAHLQRINANILYAIAQDNNHGTSEAAALFIGGHWLLNSGFSYPQASSYAQKGRYWLENRLNKLVEDDGSFSQHSVTYHRLLLDTLIFVEYWRQRFGIKPFGGIFYKRVEGITEWLYNMTDDVSGNCPNLGANDGSLFLNLHSCGYRNFRPSLQSAAGIFLSKKYFDDGGWDEPLYWFGRLSRSMEKIKINKVSKIFKGGYIIIHSLNSWCLIRFPHFRFRPSHNDVFHFDLWFRGMNILQDAGSYSYNPSNGTNGFNFRSVHAHNTVCFDDQEQMVILSRFLLGNWIQPDEIGPIVNHSEKGQSWQGAYRDGRGNTHRRKINNNGNVWIVEDQLLGNFKVAKVSFNLINEEYSILGSTIKASWGKIKFSAGTSFRIVDSISSDYYMEMHTVKRVEVKLDSPQIFVTEIHLE